MIIIYSEKIIINLSFFALYAQDLTRRAIEHAGQHKHCLPDISAYLLLKLNVRINCLGSPSSNVPIRQWRAGEVESVVRMATSAEISMDYGRMISIVEEKLEF